MHECAVHANVALPFGYIELLWWRVTLNFNLHVSSSYFHDPVNSTRKKNQALAYFYLAKYSEIDYEMHGI